MTNSSTNSGSGSTTSMIDAVRRLAFKELLIPEQMHEAAAPPRRGAAPEPRLDVETLSPGDRDRAFELARRRLAFQVLFELDLQGITDAEAPQFIADAMDAIEGLGPMDAARVGALTLASFSSRAVADAEIAGLAPEWPTHRQPGADRAILRLAHQELTRNEPDPRIVINEAVELAKHFSTERSPAFVNAVLDKVLKRLRGEADAAA
ncbi:MAG: transcription antitermination factor NusB [Planctomycetota bacterium]|nr:transcription antitermination factor NusB [Planctomycetota bacterium]